MAPRVFATRHFPDRVRAELERSFELDLHDSEWPPPRDELLRRAAGCDGLMTMLTDRIDRKSTRLNSSHIQKSRMPSSA